MSYSIIANDIIDVDKLVKQIKLYPKKFQDYEKSFIHCKNVEEFERRLESQVPDLSYKISQIYGSGRDLAIAIPSHIYRCLTIERTSLLKTGIDDLERQITGLKDRAKSDHFRINKVYEGSGYKDWAICEMLSITLKMCRQLDEILTIISIIKTSYSYQIQSREITAAEVRNLMRAEMNTINNSGNFQNNQVSTGNGNTMTINQNKSEELGIICSRLIDVIEQSKARPEEKQTVKAIVYEIENAKSPIDLKEAYSKLTSAISNHITIGTAILGSSILPTLTNLIL